MTKLLVFSDTHNSSRRMPAVLEREKNVTACFFLGDGSSDADILQHEYPRMPLYRVCGNCDYAGFDPAEGLAPFGQHLIFYTHGHNYGVKSSLDTLAQAAEARGAGIALFGHTHIPYHEFNGRVHLFNPGSLSIPRSGGPTYGRIFLKGPRPIFEIRHY